MATKSSLLRLLQTLWDYVNNAFWNIAMAENANKNRAFMEEEDCDWP